MPSKYGLLKTLAILVIVLSLLYVDLRSPNVYMKLWFAWLWSLIAVVTILSVEVRNGWWNGRLRLPPWLQIVLASVLVLTAVLASDWTLGRRDVLQWAATFFTLPVYRDGFAWAWAQLRGRGTNQSPQ